MANAKISQLPAVTSAAGGDLAVAVASSVTSQITVDNLFKNRTLVAPALGTPASGTLTNCTGLPVSTGVAGLGAGVATFLATPSSANLATAVTGETGSGALVFGTGPTISAPVLTLKTYTVAQLGGLTAAVGDVAVATDGDAGLNWGNEVVNTGGGATAYQVWYNGSKWNVTGK